jgi:hypothetical protein
LRFCPATGVPAAQLPELFPVERELGSFQFPQTSAWRFQLHLAHALSSAAAGIESKQIQRIAIDIAGRCTRGEDLA